jgi:hypothetical protein
MLSYFIFLEFIYATHDGVTGIAVAAFGFEAVSEGIHSIAHGTLSFWVWHFKGND